MPPKKTTGRQNARRRKTEQALSQDPVDVGEHPFDPLHYDNLGKSLIQALLGRSPLPLGDLPRFRGYGIYAIYYTGNFAPYAPLVAEHQRAPFGRPIYVGKAEPEGVRKGGRDVSAASYKLYNRLREHATTIRHAKTTLDIADFFCRYLVVVDVWIGLGEQILIDTYDPLWNVYIDGFGSKVPGSERKGTRSLWDTLHPGRPWEKDQKDNPKDVLEIVRQAFASIEAAKLPESARRAEAESDQEDTTHG